MECAHNDMDTSVCLFNMLFSDWIIQLHYFFMCMYESIQ